VHLPIAYQRAEGAALFGAGLYFYGVSGYSWIRLGLLLFVVDIFMVGYLFGKYWGANIYNLGHSLSIPASLAVAGYVTKSSWPVELAFIWLTHIGMDRALGFGLKTTKGFTDTHLRKINDI